MKRCYKCQEVKPLSGFHRHKKAKDGHAGSCKVCTNKASKAWACANHDRVVQYRKDNLKKFVEQNKWRYRMKKYGLTKDQFFSIRERQDNRCKICATKFIREPHVDHCHTTDKVRGLLCSKCNTALGLVNDSPEILNSMIVYLMDNP